MARLCQNTPLGAFGASGHSGGAIHCSRTPPIPGSVPIAPGCRSAGAQVAAFNDPVNGLYRRVGEPDVLQRTDLGDLKSGKLGQKPIDVPVVVLRSAIGYQVHRQLLRVPSYGFERLNKSVLYHLEA